MRGGRHRGRRAEQSPPVRASLARGLGRVAGRRLVHVIRRRCAGDRSVPLAGGSKRSLPAPFAAPLPPRGRHAESVPGSTRVPGRRGERGALRHRHRGQRRRRQEHGGQGTAGPDLPLAGDPRGWVGEHRRLSLSQQRPEISGLDGTQGFPRELRPAAPAEVPRRHQIRSRRGERPDPLAPDLRHPHRQDPGA